ncbi:hypothetical protein RJ639_017879 [Escallonia herrerae]|uniref:CMP/dCMP-type deaminase domain-containing protein n=1 Tax=Escallonia herrerae TaxID=1293975 RepID=A0AA88V6J1_9ASTE|nr:hypothetical protein RJ639_017879 [Escallonia herrerae]
MKHAADLADKSAGFTSPHPNFGCVIATGSGRVVGEGFLYAQGTKPAEVQAVEAAGELCRGATAYLNLEPGDCHGDHTAVSALVKPCAGHERQNTGQNAFHDGEPRPSCSVLAHEIIPRAQAILLVVLEMGVGGGSVGEVQAGIGRVVIGIRHPLQHLRSNAIRTLRSEGLQVDVLGEDLRTKHMEVADSFDVAEQGRANQLSLEIKSLCRSVSDSSQSFHSFDDILCPPRMNVALNFVDALWEALKSCLLVNAPLLYRSAFRVPYSVLKYAMTLDGKTATTEGHAKWISSNESRTRVFDLRGRSDAVIVGGNTVRLDELWQIDPRLTARHGGGHLPMRIVMSRTLDLPEVANLWDVAEVHTIVATQRGAKRNFQKFLASKGVEVVEFDILNPNDVMGYLYDRGYLSILWECGGALSASAISSGVIHKVFAFVAPKIIGGKNAPTPVGDLGMVEMTQSLELSDVCYEQVGPDMLISGFLQPVPDPTPVIPSVDETSAIDPTLSPYESSIIFFYKTWDPYGSFSNFSPHPIRMPDEDGDYITWSSVEHYYQANKFVGMDDPVARNCVEDIRAARSPEEAARMGRKIQGQRPDLVRSDWESVKIDVMYKALKCKFSIYPHLSYMLLETAGSILVEASPHDLFWGGGRDGEGLNYLGRLLMQLRSEFLGETSVPNERSVTYPEGETI